MKRVVIAIIVVVFVISMVGFVNAATKYDGITKVPFYQKASTEYDKIAKKHPIMADYLDLVINMDDINRICRDGSLGKEKTEFLSKNKRSYLSFAKAVLGGELNKMIDPNTKDAEWIYIIGVIKTHKQGLSITSRNKNDVVPPENAAVENALFEENTLYKYWKISRRPGNIEDMISKHIDTLYQKTKK